MYNRLKGKLFYVLLLLLGCVFMRIICMMLIHLNIVQKRNFLSKKMESNGHFINIYFGYVLLSQFILMH